jgi:hypothetical protein
MVETVLDMPIYFYDWGNTDDIHLLRPESFVDELSARIPISFYREEISFCEASLNFGVCPIHYWYFIRNCRCSCPFQRFE